MDSSQVRRSLTRIFEAEKKLPVFLWGAPGIGKSDVVRQTADAIGAKVIDVRATLLDPVDLRGIPHVNGDSKAHWCTPDFLPTEDDGKVVLFLDELNAAPPLVQASCYQLILDRQLGEYHLPDSVYIVAAGNRETDRAVTNRMPTALANRFIHLSFEVDTDAWCEWALDNNIVPELIAFIRFRPELLHKFDPAHDTSKAFPSPRTWEFVSNLLKLNMDDDIEYENLAGTVGQGAAVELKSFLDVARKLPSPDSILMDVDAADVPSDPNVLYALTSALATRASEDTADRICRYASRLPAEFSVLLVKDCLARSDEFSGTRGFVEWSTKHSNVLF